MTRILFACLLAVCSWSKVYGQGSVTIHSADGYDVKVTISNLILNKTPYPGNPTGGCNYTITLSYNIQFLNGNPGSMWTLQGYFRCNQSSYFDLPNNGGSGTTTSANASYNGNPATLTIASICNKIDIEIHGPGINSMLVSIPIGGGSALPIELLNFDAEANGQQVNLVWSTATERDNDYFTIEKTTDGISYVTVGEVKGAGNSTTRRTYSYTDYSPSAGVSYYRLKQTDYNGASETFDVIGVQVAKSALISNVYPNPSADSRINVAVAESGSVVAMNIYNMFGQLVATRNIDATFGNATETVELPESGNTFFVELISNNEVVARHKVLTTRN